MDKTKEELRVFLKKARLNIGVSGRLVKSQLICQRLIDVKDWSRVSTILLYSPKGSLGEVDIKDFVNYLSSECPKMQLLTTAKVNQSWQVVSLEGELSRSPKIDVVVLPMLGFDLRLYRLGYGGGFYDRFLAKYPKALKIGVCFSEGRLDKLSIEPHDISLNMVITEAQVYS